jgi:histidinol-phosphatase (PHP family)
MGWTNYHGHCNYCDGKGEIEAYILKAIELNMSAIGISSHAPVPFSTTWNMPMERLSDYLEEIRDIKRKYKKQITVLASLEVDYIPGVIQPSSPFITECNLDYTIGSVHFMGEMENGEHWAIDGSFSEFTEGLNELFQGDIKKVVQSFYALQREMISLSKPDIIGHFDKIKMHNKTSPLFDESASWYLDEVRHTLEHLKEAGTIVEINTKAIDRNGLLFPGPEHFKWLKELDIPITINSDAHHPNKLLNGFEEVAAMLSRVGIKHQHEFIVSEWQPVAIEES